MKTLYRLAVGLSLLVLVACTTQNATPAPVELAFQPYIGRSLSYLVRQIDDTGLLHATEDLSSKHWLEPDGLLALWALKSANAKDAATRLEQRIAKSTIPPDGLIETLQHAVVGWPPRSVAQAEIEPGVWVETHTGDQLSEEWRQDSDLLLYAALNAWNDGRKEEANALYAEALKRFDGKGFSDGLSPREYATATLALAIFTGARLQQPVSDTLVQQLIAQQGPSGGFPPAYSAAGSQGTPDTRTTALAALALLTVRQE